MNPYVVDNIRTLSTTTATSCRTVTRPTHYERVPEATRQLMRRYPPLDCTTPIKTVVTLTGCPAPHLSPVLVAPLARCNATVLAAAPLLRSSAAAAAHRLRCVVGLPLLPMSPVRRLLLGPHRRPLRRGHLPRRCHLQQKYKVSGLDIAPLCLLGPHRRPLRRGLNSRTLPPAAEDQGLVVGHCAPMLHQVALSSHFPGFCQMRYTAQLQGLHSSRRLCVKRDIKFHIL